MTRQEIMQDKMDEYKWDEETTYEYDYDDDEYGVCDICGEIHDKYDMYGSRHNNVCTDCMSEYYTPEFVSKFAEDTIDDFREEEKVFNINPFKLFVLQDVLKDIVDRELQKLIEDGYDFTRDIKDFNDGNEDYFADYIKSKEYRK